MRLTEEQIGKICRLILSHLKEKNLISLKAPEEKIIHRLQEIFMSDLKVEDELNEEVEKILREHEAEFGEVDRRKMFQLIKKKIIRERNLVI